MLAEVCAIRTLFPHRRVAPRLYRAGCVTCLRLDVSSQHVTARKMLQSETLRYPTRHGAFPGARCPHYHRPKNPLQTHALNSLKTTKRSVKNLK